MSINQYRAPNPSDPVAFPKLRIERAPDPGNDVDFVQIANVDVDTSQEATVFVDTAGTPTSWYRHRGANAAGTQFTDFSTKIQFGDYQVRQWIISDIPDTSAATGVTLTHWDQWRDETLQDLANAGLGRPAPIQTINPPFILDPSSGFTSSTVTQEFFGLNADIRRVLRVDVYDNTGWFLSIWRNWYQRGRTLRIIHAKFTLTYKVYGIGEIRCLSDLDDEFFNVLKWGMRMRYADFRKLQRFDFRPFLARTRQTDTSSVVDFDREYKTAKAEFEQRLDRAVLHQGLETGLGASI